MALEVEVVSPERILYSGEAAMVITRTTDGEIAFLTGHVPFIGSLGIGRVIIRTDEGDEVVAAVHGGFVEVNDDRVTVLSDVAELVDDIDVDRARQALERAEKGDDQDEDDVDAAKRRARLRLELAER
jgi:F-type H+-transporting ATPase subunit epsilon